MLILGIDSSTEVAAIGLIKDGEVLGEVNVSLYRRHSERLMPNIDHLFTELEYDIEDVDGIGVTVGPGSFTGLRIGISTVKGFAQVLDVPVVGVSTLDVIAYNFNYVNGLVVPMLDARRKRVYTSLYDLRDNEKIIYKNKEWADKTLPIEDLINDLFKYEEDSVFYLTGNGVNEYRETLLKQDIKLVLTPSFFHKPKGGAVAELSEHLLNEGRDIDLDQLGPRYLKKPQAEINYKRIGSE